MCIQEKHNTNTHAGFVNKKIKFGFTRRTGWPLESTVKADNADSKFTRVNSNSLFSGTLD
jgi:hypothetical protein